MQLSDRIGRRMKLQDLHVLMTVLKAGSMGKAARLLNSTQPNVSRSIADLEHAFGVRLLDRHRQGVEPTKYGRALLDCGVAVFDDLRQGVKNIEFLADPTAGEVRIGSIPPLAASFVPTVIDRLSRGHPGIVFHLVSESTELLHLNLHQRNVDMLVTQRVALSQMMSWVLKSSMTTRTLLSRVCKIHGFGGARSRSANWSTNYGRCRHRNTHSGRSSKPHFAPMDWIIPARQCSHGRLTRGSACWRPVAISRFSRQPG